jgi:ElaB/YqjD/DUF883 family membrane-anchored ribosome-binding protein
LGCGWFSGVCNAVSKKVEQVKTAVVNTVDTVVQVATDVVNKGIDLVKDTVSDIKNTYNEVKKDVQDTGKKVVKNVSDKAHQAAHWVNEHKAQIAGIAAGILVGLACEAVTAGVGTIGCAALAGAVGSMVEYGVGKPRDQWSLGGFAKAGLIGGVTGALGGAAGKLLAKGVGLVAGKVIGKFGSRAAGAESAGARAATEGAEDASETFYRGMSNAEYAGLESSGGLSVRGESFVTQELGYVQQLAARHPNLYETIVKFEVRSGTRQTLIDAGARSPGRAVDDAGLGHLPLIQKGMKDVVHVKGELGAINFGLRPGSADIFNSRIISFGKLNE